MANVLIEEQTMSDIANAIREKNGTDTTYKPAEMPQAVMDIETQTNQLTKCFVMFEQCFYNAKFKTKTDIIIEYGEMFLGSFYGCFSFTSNLKSVKFIGPKKETVNLSNTFSRSDVEIIDISNVIWRIKGDITNSFYNCSKLISIFGVLDVSGVTKNNNSFYGCTSLKDITFANESIKLSSSFAFSPLLSDESIQSIIDGLANLTGQTAQTITLNKEVKSKLTEEQIAIITSKNWTLA